MKKVFITLAVIIGVIIIAGVTATLETRKKKKPASKS